MSDEQLFARTDEAEYIEADPHDSGMAKHLIFLSNGLYYGINADIVKEIITKISITHLPMLPRHVSGVINLRGQIVPIVDFRILLGQEPAEEYCTVVLDIEDTQIGILTDLVDRMVDIDLETILPVPRTSESDNQGLITGMCTIPNESATMMVVDFSTLLHEQ